MNLIPTKIAAAIALAITGTAFSVHARQPSASGGGGFLTFDGGIAMQEDIMMHDPLLGSDVKTKFDQGLRFDMLLGGHVRPNWTTGIEVGVIYNKVKEINGAEPLSDISLYEVPLLLNVTWQLPIPGPLKFYGGGGVGGVFSVWDGVSSGSSSFTTDWTFGFQGVAGVKYALGSKWDLDGTYKYLGTTGHENFNGTFTHAFVASITCKF